jgi:hypothetical protein
VSVGILSRACVRLGRGVFAHPLDAGHALPDGWDADSTPFGEEDERTIAELRAEAAAASLAAAPPMDPENAVRLYFIRAHAGRVFVFTYTNWRNETAERRATFAESTLRFGVAEFHPEPSWLLDGVDYPRAVVRTFDVARMTDLRVEEPAR